jgi:hypothetical protein
MYYDGEGKSYFRNGWLRFGADYDIQPGFFLIFLHHSGMAKFTVCIYDGTMCCCSYAARA